ncbi:methyltransferase family protein [Breoghania corrubedonensis]|uniref:Methyltransferase family protein n=1 Tax=Breoghania corrubedonensis TaxID=665038 RepID=A0A2T5VFE6_9HYPH|nr:class I SAM-dependent methyltransferase [Breoghania corrubedonensis]PTW62487.1 methyltransferase family protein [Breoghania corrubedonensis]
MTKKAISDYTAANRAVWEASAPLHEQGAQWDALLAQASTPEFSVLDSHLTNTLRALNLAGGTAFQVGCNNARELLSLRALGLVPKLGIDQSAAFLSQAVRLASACDAEVNLVEADVYDLPPGLGTFDLGLITIGVLNWMPDLPAFFRIVADLLADGGRLVIYETHPILEIFDPAGATPHEPAFSYFDSSPQKIEEIITYDGQDHGKGETGYWFLHTMGDIVTACAKAGLRIAELTEYPHSNREPQYDLYQGRAAQIPMCYCLVAAKTA